MPLAMILTKSSSARGSVSSTCSTVKSPKRSRATAAVICIAISRLLRKGRLQFAVLVLRRVDDHLLVAGQVLIEAAALNVLKLHDNGACLCPFAKLVEPDRSDNGAKFVVVDVLRKLVVVETVGGLDRLLQHLHGGIGKRRLIKTERINAGVFRLRLVLFQEVLDAGEIHLRAGDVKMIVDHPIELFGKLRDEGR